MPKQTVSQITGCQSCPVRNRFPDATFVPCKEGYGKRLVVSDRPGEEDAIKGAPLSGGAGRVFDSLIKKAGVERAELTILHTTNCWDAKADYFDYKAGTAHCFNAHVEPVLRSRDWERIDLLGEEALEALTGEYGISKWRGSPMQVPLLDPEKYLALPTLHPVKLMKEQALWPVVAGDLKKSIQPPPEIYNLYPSVPELQAFRPRRFTFDIETPQYRTLGKDAPVEIVGLCAERYKAMVAPFTSAYKPEIVRLFAEAAEVIGQNLIQFDLPRLAKEGVVISDDCQIWDIMLLHHLRFPNLSGEAGREKQEKNNSGGHDLEFISSQFTSKPAWKADKSDLSLYCARDTDVTQMSFEELYKLCQQAGLLDLYKLVQVPLAKICYLMQEQGIQRDPSRLAEVRKQLIAEIAEDELALPEALRSHQIAKKRRVLAPEGTLSEKTKKPVKYIHVDDVETIQPWRSPKFKQDFLYNVCKLEIQRDPKEGTVTVGKWALDRLYRRNKETHSWLLKLKRVCKNGHMLSGFCKEDTQGPVTRLHPSFNVHGTSSGRLSSSGDAGNFQNQPPTARALYVPSHPDWEMMEVDYSQIENRLTAYLAKDTLRLQRYIDDPDFSEHKYAASIFFNMKMEDVEKDNDRETPYGKAKPIVHGPWHPSAEVLTPLGWVAMANYKEGTPIAEWEKGRIVFRVPKQIIRQNYDANLIEYDSHYFKTCVTPEHGFPVKESWTNKVKNLETRNLTGNHTAFVCGEFDFGDLETDVRLAAAIQADGSLMGRFAVFHFTKERKKKRLEEILGDRPYRKRACGCHPDGTRYLVPTEVVEPALWILDAKQFNENVLDLTREKAQELLDEVFYWDGSRPNKGGRLYFNKNKTSAEWVQTLAHLLGKRAYFREEDHWRGGKFYRVYVSDARTTVRVPQERKEVPYKGEVICFTTEAGYFLARYKNTIVVSCNSNYGMGAKKISEQYDMDLTETKDLLFKWKQEIRKTVEWQKDVAKLAEQQGYLSSPFGRKRWFYTSKLYTESLSFIPQSTAADVIFRAMIATYYERINWPLEKVKQIVRYVEPLPKPARLVLQVHDSCLFEYPIEMREQVLGAVKRVFQQPWPELKEFSVPISVSIGRSWGETKPYISPKTL